MHLCLTLCRLVCLATLIVLFVTPSTAQPKIVNGSFEQGPVQPIASGYGDTNPSDVTGWTHTGAIAAEGLFWHTGFVCCGGTNTGLAGDGNQWVTLGAGFGEIGSAAWSQTITGLTAGQSYVISFKIASEGEVSTQTIDVSMTSGSSTPLKTFTTLDGTEFWQVWGSNQYTFCATATSATLQFSVTNAIYDVGLDGVSIAAAPNVPGSNACAGTPFVVITPNSLDGEAGRDTNQYQHYQGALDFGATTAAMLDPRGNAGKSDPQVVTIRNAGTGDLHISAITLEPPGAGDFEVSDAGAGYVACLQATPVVRQNPPRVS
jgi:hypothetical protein